MFAIEIDGRDLQKFSAVERELAHITGTEGIPRWVRKDIRDGAKELAKDARLAVLGTRTKGRKHTGLRARVAKGVTTSDTPSGARITAAADDRDERDIPRGMDSPKGWSHPVFGNRNVWVRQRGRFGWWSDTMEGAEDKIRPAVEKSLQDAAERVAHTV